MNNNKLTIKINPQMKKIKHSKDNLDFKKY